MTAYTFQTESAWVEHSGGASVTPVMPSFTAGWLGVLVSGESNQTGNTCADPAGWTRQSPLFFSAANVLIGIWTRVLVGGDTAPTVAWSGTGYTAGKILTFSGDVYADQSSITDDSDANAGSSTNNIKYPNSTPTLPNDLLIFMGFRSKTATTNGATIATLSGFTKSALADSVPSGGAQASTVQYWQQTTATSVTNGSLSYSLVDSNLDNWGVIVALKSQAAAGSRSSSLGLLGVGN